MRAGIDCSPYGIQRHHQGYGESRDLDSNLKKEADNDRKNEEEAGIKKRLKVMSERTLAYGE